MPDVQERKEATELRTRLQTLSEILSKCSHNVTETQRSLSCLGEELLKNRDQIHEDNKSIQKIQCCLDKMHFIYKQFKKSRMRPG